MTCDLQDGSEFFKLLLGKLETILVGSSSKVGHLLGYNSTAGTQVHGTSVIITAGLERAVLWRYHIDCDSMSVAVFAAVLHAPEASGTSCLLQDIAKLIPHLFRGTFSWRTVCKVGGGPSVLMLHRPAGMCVYYQGVTFCHEYHIYHIYQADWARQDKHDHGQQCLPR
jgi:hypothetical protein